MDNKKQYSAPKLVTYGKVSDLTQTTNISNPTSDGGSGFNTYAS